MSASAWIEVEEKRDYLDLGYLVEFSISRSVDISPALFIHRFDDDTYSHVATIADLRRWPDNRADAATGERMFYRRSVARRELETLGALVGFVAHVRTRLREVVQAWDPQGELRVPGDETYTIGAGT